jgi:uncharacterized protein (TIGR03067 family)
MDDSKLIQGVWQVIHFEQEGEKPISSDKLKEMTYRFAMNKIAISYKGRALEGIFTLNPKTKPKSIDFIHNDRTEPGIYKLEKNQLTICMVAVKGNLKRPIDFATKKGSKTMLVVLERSKQK